MELQRGCLSEMSQVVRSTFKRYTGQKLDVFIYDRCASESSKERIKIGPYRPFPLEKPGMIGI